MNRPYFKGLVRATDETPQFVVPFLAHEITTFIELHALLTEFGGLVKKPTRKEEEQEEEKEEKEEVSVTLAVVGSDSSLSYYRVAIPQI